MDPFADTLQQLREAFGSGCTRLAEFRAAQLKGLSRFLQENKQLLQEALAQDLHKSCFAVVLGGPQETGQLLEHKFDYIFFTGEAPVWGLRRMGETVANRVAFFRYFNSGQTCVAPDYILCSPEMQARLLPALQSAITRFYGEDPQSSPDLGRIISEKNFQRLRGLLSCGRVAIGGQSDESDRYIGASGMGSYHGKFSFDTFSHHRACLLRRPGLEKVYALRYPPHTPRNLSVLLMAMETRSCSCALL
ncbi:hypothetical protein E2I00_000657 [Balaenoptera physalus]|uniref:Aldehyde dehydrogenase domain-containing protein n=1 Tax=Balaenoptera physalus TaxID=9770 RepID=A0A6A1QDI3_BALPH|nr:hypothetical protein E2I00_000657 [Balaenoptera physalus]